METRINPNQVSHITISDAKKGREYYWYGHVDYVWMEAEYFKFLWLFKTPFKNYEEGYYRNCKRKWISNDTPTELRKSEYTLLGEIYTLPKVLIFSGEKEIKRRYFETIEEAKELATSNFPNCNVIIK